MAHAVTPVKIQWDAEPLKAATRQQITYWIEKSTPAIQLATETTTAVAITGTTTFLASRAKDVVSTCLPSQAVPLAHQAIDAVATDLSSRVKAQVGSLVDSAVERTSEVMETVLHQSTDASIDGTHHCHTKITGCLGLI